MTPRFTPQPEPLARVIWRNRLPVAAGLACYGGSAVIMAILIGPALRLAGAACLIAWMLCGGK